MVHFALPLGVRCVCVFAYPSAAAVTFCFFGGVHRRRTQFGSKNSSTMASRFAATLGKAIRETGQAADRLGAFAGPLLFAPRLESRPLPFTLLLTHGAHANNPPRHTPRRPRHS